MNSLAAEYFGLVIDPFFNPQKRVFVGYLGVALLIALGVQLFALRHDLHTAFGDIFTRRIWLSASARTDYKILLVNQAVMMSVAPRLITKLAIATGLFEYLHVWFDGRSILWPTSPGWLIAVLFTFVLFIIDDLAKYLVHRALHRWPLLWHFHRVHHNAETLTPLTVYRTHPVEGVIFALRATVVQGVSVALFIYFFGSRAELLTLLGVNVILFFFNAVGSNLRHSHVWVSYGRIVERLFISPAQHQIHHSINPVHHDRNFGAVLAIWDWMAGSLYLAKKGQIIRFGAGDGRLPEHDLMSIYLKPCIAAAQDLIQPIVRGFKSMFIITALIPGKPVTTAILAAVFGATSLVGLALASDAPRELNIYSHRQPFLIKPFIDAYKAKTDTKINILFSSKGLAQRLQAEGTRSPADVILTVDIARLNVYADKKLLAPVHSNLLMANVPTHLRDSENRWFALSKRARIIIASNTATDTHGIRKYEDLANPKWRGRICVRPGSHVYNRALVASMINAGGKQAAESWAKGVVENLARRPQGNDRAQVKAIFEGVCDLAVINNYYYGKLKHSDKSAQRNWAGSVKLIFPNQNGRGTHVNISGGGVAKHSKHKAEAVRFLEFLTSKIAQELYGTVNFEYPVNPRVPPPPELASWGKFKEDKMSIARIADLAPAAQKVIDRVGW